MISAEHLTGVILAGGKSRRMGRDKALLQFHGREFITLIADVLQSLFMEVVISSCDAEAYKFTGLRVIPDVFSDCGPLGGIHAALGEVQTPSIFVVSCDMPFITRDAAEFLLHYANYNEITVIEEHEHIHPLFGVYPTTARKSIERYLDEGKRGVLNFLKSETVHCEIIRATELTAAVSNINTPEEYERISDKAN